MRTSLLIALGCIALAFLYSIFSFIKTHGVFETVTYIFIIVALLLLTNYTLLIFWGPQNG